MHNLGMLLLTFQGRKIATINTAKYLEKNTYNFLYNLNQNKKREPKPLCIIVKEVHSIGD